MENNNKFAGFWIRHIALFIDILILFCLWIIIWLILEFLWMNLTNATALWIFVWLIIDLIWFIYFACFHYCFWQTPWKMAVWVKVVDKEFWDISLIQSVWRSFATILSTIPLFLWYAWASWDSKKRTFHDMLAQTVVVEKNPISKNLIIFWNVLIFWLSFLIVFWFVGLFYYLIQNPELLINLSSGLDWDFNLDL